MVNSSCFLLTDLREMVFEDQGEEANDDHRVISPHFHAGLCCTHSCFCPFCCPQSHCLFCLALKETPCPRGPLECVESSWGRKMCKIRERTHMESQMRVRLSLNVYIYAFSGRFYPKRLIIYSGYNFFFYRYVCSLGIEPMNFCAANAMLYLWATGTDCECLFGFTVHKHSCTCSIEFPAPYGTPNIFATSGLDAPRTAEDDGKLPWHVSISLGAGYECSGAIIRSQWILTDAYCVYNLWATNMQETLKNDHWKKTFKLIKNSIVPFLWWLIISL